MEPRLSRKEGLNRAANSKESGANQQLRASIFL